MSIDRRNFLIRGTSAAAATALHVLPRPLVRLGQTAEPMPDVRDTRLKEVLLRGLDAARAAGAIYADVRLTHERYLEVNVATAPSLREAVAVNIRALVNGYWGFAASSDVSADALVRLGRTASELARINAVGKTRSAELAPAPVVTGHWETPVVTDPLALNPYEIYDYLRGLHLYASLTPNARNVNSRIRFMHSATDKVFGSTTGSYCTQRLRWSEGELQFAVQLARGGFGVDMNSAVSRSAVGWELFTGTPLRDRLDETIVELREWRSLPAIPVDPGRYDLLLSAALTARLASISIGRATQADRVFGYEANAGGTSYVTHPLAMVGALHVGAPLFTVTANRSEPGALATCRWDDEGVIPESFTLIDRGVLATLGTGRESASWLAGAARTPETAATPAPALRSHGCMTALSAEHAPLVHTPNLTVVSKDDGPKYNDLMTGMEDGLAILELGGGNVEMDHQQVAGQASLSGLCVVKKGKRVGRPAGALSLRFRTSELWKNLSAVGGAASARRSPFDDPKGQPERMGHHSVTAPPVVVKQLALYDPNRR